jgi:2-amino-4-hydroxy-6-hydroxymethyldihydropteridine diphosphokinase
MQRPLDRVNHAYVAFGANMGDPSATFAEALRELAPDVRVVAVSPAYRTRAIGPEQPDYLNLVAEVETALAPLDLLHRLQALEVAHGRVRDLRWGPRTLDLDVIWYGGLECDGPELILPHPRAHQREFVLRPLCDLAPGLELHGRPASEWLAGLEPQGVARAD